MLKPIIYKTFQRNIRIIRNERSCKLMNIRYLSEYMGDSITYRYPF